MNETANETPRTLHNQALGWSSVGDAFQRLGDIGNAVESWKRAAKCELLAARKLEEEANERIWGAELILLCSAAALFLRGGQLGPAETVAQRVLAHPALCMNALVETRARFTMDRIRESSALLNATNRLSSVPEEFWPGGTHGQ